MPKEIWMSVSEFPEYFVSSLGSLKSKYNKRLSFRLDKDGYKIARFSCNGKRFSRRLNRIVCIAFHNMPETKNLQAAHRDGNKLNNSADNLYWASPKQNSEDKIKHGVSLFGESMPSSKLKEKEVLQILQEYNAHINERRKAGFCYAKKGWWNNLKLKYSVSQGNLTRIVSGIKWTYLHAT